MSNNDKTITPFSVGDRVLYYDHGVPKFGKIFEIQTLYGRGAYRYKIVFDGETESDGLYYNHTDLSAVKSNAPAAQQDSGQILYCRKCGTQLSPGVAFCRKCGTKVIYEAQTEDTSTQDRSTQDDKKSDSDSAAGKSSASKPSASISEDELHDILKEITTLKRYEAFLEEIKGDFSAIEDLIQDTRARLLADLEKISYETALQKIIHNSSDNSEINYDDPLVAKLCVILGKEPEKPIADNLPKNKLYRQPSKLSDIETYDDFMKRYSK